ncbi:tetratricopeptide repeat protein, partial [Streptomyces sp. SID7834]
LEIDPLYEWAVGSRAQLFERMGRYEEALADYDRAVVIDPEYAWALGSRARVKKDMGRSEEAVADYSRAVEILPDYAWAFQGRAQVYAGMGRHDEALADFARALELRPGYGWALGNRGELYEKLGRREDAVADFTRAIEIDPTSDWVLGARARTYLCMGRHEDALADCARTVEIDPRDGWNQMLYGVVLRAAGDAPAAEARFADALRLFTEEGAGAGDAAVNARQGLLVLHCALFDHGAAASVADALIALGPGRNLIEEAVEDLSLLGALCPEARQGIEPVTRRLRETLRQG